MELDIEDKKMNMTLDAAKKRDLTTTKNDPYYDNLE